MIEESAALTKISAHWIEKQSCTTIKPRWVNDARGISSWRAQSEMQRQSHAQRDNFFTAF
jgi:hypothetical protein